MCCDWPARKSARATILCESVLGQCERTPRLNPILFTLRETRTCGYQPRLSLEPEQTRLVAACPSSYLRLNLRKGPRAVADLILRNTRAVEYAYQQVGHRRVFRELQV